MVDKPFSVIALEELNTKKIKKNSRRFDHKLGNWSYGQLSTFIKYKAETLGKPVVEVNPKNITRMCSRCGYTSKTNRKGLAFKCEGCGFELNDLNASRNIAVLGMSEYGRLCVNEPIVASGEPFPTGTMDDSYKLPPFKG